MEAWTKVCPQRLLLSTLMIKQQLPARRLHSSGTFNRMTLGQLPPPSFHTAPPLLLQGLPRPSLNFWPGLSPRRQP